MEFIPTTLAENAGLDPIDIITELKSMHDFGDKSAGLNLFTNKIGKCSGSKNYRTIKNKKSGNKFCE